MISHVYYTYTCSQVSTCQTIGHPRHTTIYSILQYIVCIDRIETFDSLGIWSVARALFTLSNHWPLLSFINMFLICTSISYTLYRFNSNYILAWQRVPHSKSKRKHAIKKCRFLLLSIGFLPMRYVALGLLLLTLAHP